MCIFSKFFFCVSVRHLATLRFNYTTIKRSNKLERCKYVKRNWKSYQNAVCVRCSLKLAFGNYKNVCIYNNVHCLHTVPRCDRQMIIKTRRWIGWTHTYNGPAWCAAYYIYLDGNRHIKRETTHKQNMCAEIWHKLFLSLIFLENYQTKSWKKLIFFEACTISTDIKTNYSFNNPHSFISYIRSSSKESFLGLPWIWIN